MRTILIAIAVLGACNDSHSALERSAEAAPVREEDPLPSWNPGSAKRSIVAFVGRVTRMDGPDYVPPAERIAVFDNDGTLWAEQPTYVQLAFALDRVKQLEPRHPEWQTESPFAQVLKGKTAALVESGERGIAALVTATHGNMSSEEFTSIVGDWITTARNPQTGRRYIESVYQPMLELMRYLRANGFTTFIVSGGGVEFMRPWTERVYGVPPQNVIGSRAKLEYRVVDGVPQVYRLPVVDFVDDKAGKPIGIQQAIGRRPIAAFGNSDGDFEMLQWVTTGRGPRFGMLVHHTDATREWAYDRTSKIGRLSRGLDEAAQRGWIVADMKKDWRTVFPPHSERR